MARLCIESFCGKRHFSVVMHDQRLFSDKLFDREYVQISDEEACLSIDALKSLYTRGAFSGKAGTK